MLGVALGLVEGSVLDDAESSGVDVESLGVGVTDAETDELGLSVGVSLAVGAVPGARDALDASVLAAGLLSPPVSPPATALSEEVTTVDELGGEAQSEL